MSKVGCNVPTICTGEPGVGMPVVSLATASSVCALLPLLLAPLLLAPLLLPLPRMPPPLLLLAVIVKACWPMAWPTVPVTVIC
jgi:hypothetical protein